jgi:tripartite-type tricarboxylate transporter receptor subunit TctC
MDLTGYFTLMGPAGMPRPIVEQLHKWVNEVVATDETKAFLNKFASDPWVSSPGEGQTYFLKDIGAWQDYIRIAKIEPQG